jgi:hypothetical protein
VWIKHRRASNCQRQSQRRRKRKQRNRSDRSATVHIVIILVSFKSFRIASCQFLISWSC